MDEVGMQTSYNLNLNRSHGTADNEGRWNLRIIEGMTAEEIGDWVLKQIRRDSIHKYLPSTAPETEAAREVYRKLRDAAGLPVPKIGGAPLTSTLRDSADPAPEAT